MPDWKPRWILPALPAEPTGQHKNASAAIASTATTAAHVSLVVPMKLVFAVERTTMFPTPFVSPAMLHPIPNNWSPLMPYESSKHQKVVEELTSILNAWIVRLESGESIAVACAFSPLDDNGRLQEAYTFCFPGSQTPFHLLLNALTALILETSDPMLRLYYFTQLIQFSLNLKQES